jgi:hypothetical protein
MKDPSGPWLILVGPIVFLGFAFFTRALLPRILAALLGGVAAGALNIAWDLLGHREGWWSYPGMDGRGYGPLVWYVTGGLAFGGGFGLLGWRVHRRFGSRDLAIFLAAAGLYGAIRDWVTSRTIADGVIVFSAGALPWMADFAAWFTAIGLAQAIQIALRGDPRRERLARAPAEP